MTEPSLSIQQYADRHGVSTRTVRRWINSGRLRAIRLSKRSIRIVTKQEMEYLADTCGHLRTHP